MIPFYNPFDSYMERSEGCYLYDTNGKKYIDFESGVWCANLGHNHPAVNNVIAEQLKKTIHQGYYFKTREAVELAEKLEQITKLTAGKSVFLSSGSEAVNLAVTLAKAFTGRQRLITTDCSYLSAYGHGQNIPANSNLETIPLNDTTATDKIDFSRIAAFVMETGGASLGIIKFPTSEFLTKLLTQARRNNVLIIANEVTTGMGRTGKWFGYQHYPVQPDMVVTGKGLGNGYPVSAVSISKELAAEFEKSPFRYAQSHQNDPLGCVIASEVIRILEEENQIEKGAKTSVLFKLQLKKLMTKYTTRIKEIRGRGMMLAIEFQENFDAELLHRRLFDAGFVTGCKFNTIRFMPPLTLDKSDVIQVTNKLDEFLS